MRSKEQNKPRGYEKLKTKGTTLEEGERGERQEEENEEKLEEKKRGQNK